MNNPSHTYAVDQRMIHREVAQAAITAASTVIGSHEQRAQTRTQYVTSIGIESIKISADDEEYRFIVQVSNDGFSTNEVAAIASLGATEARIGGGVDNAVGDTVQIHWNTEVNGQSYKDWRITLVTDGTAPSIAFSALSSC